MDTTASRTIKYNGQIIRISNIFQSLPLSLFLVYIDDVLVFSNSIEHHFKYLETFQNIVRENSLVVFALKIKLFQTKIKFLGFEI